MSEATDDNLEPGLESAPAMTGQRLREARLALGLSENEIARRTSISVSYIHALENAELSSLPSMTFIKGYVRAYAIEVDLPADELVQQFSHEHDAADIQQVSSINKVGQQVKVSDPLMRVSVWFFFLAVLGVSIWWWQTQSGNSISDLIDGANDTGLKSSLTESLSGSGSESKLDVQPSDILPIIDEAKIEAPREIVPQGADTVSDDVPGLQAQKAENVEEAPSYLTAQDIARLTKELEQPASPQLSDQLERLAIQSETERGEQSGTVDSSTLAVTESLSVIVPSSGADALVQTPAIRAGTLEIVFSGDCWVSIRDQNDKLVFGKTKRAGDRLTLEVSVPANVLIGRVSSITSARFAGKELNLSEIARKDVARLTLNL